MRRQPLARPKTGTIARGPLETDMEPASLGRDICVTMSADGDKSDSISDVELEVGKGGELVGAQLLGRG
jgi:hypothetical protein